MRLLHLFVEDEDKLYREMAVAEDGLPLVGPTNITLGVRTGGRLYDIQINEDGSVEPRPVTERRGGMSVAPRTPMNLPEQHRPSELGNGSGTYPVWSISKADLGPLLIYQETSRTHGRLAPATRMSLEEYERALAATRERWARVIG
jgi:hypothetical protein